MRSGIYRTAIRFRTDAPDVYKLIASRAVTAKHVCQLKLSGLFFTLNSFFFFLILFFLADVCRPSFRPPRSTGPVRRIIITHAFRFLYVRTTDGIRIGVFISNRCQNFSCSVFFFFFPNFFIVILSHTRVRFINAYEVRQ